MSNPSIRLPRLTVASVHNVAKRHGMTVGDLVTLAVDHFNLCCIGNCGDDLRQQLRAARARLPNTLEAARWEGEK